MTGTTKLAFFLLFTFASMITYNTWVLLGLLVVSLLAFRLSRIKDVYKRQVLEKALDRACAVPLEVMTACGEGIALAAEYAEKGSVLARSDAGCAALFCKAAMQAAGLNVKVNTRLMADKARADALEARAEQLLAEFVPQADRVYQTVSNLSLIHIRCV